jgi:hypothetical protein
MANDNDDVNIMTDRRAMAELRVAAGYRTWAAFFRAVPCSASFGYQVTRSGAVPSRAMRERFARALHVDVTTCFPLALVERDEDKVA